MNVLELCLSPSLGGLELYVFRAAQALSLSTQTDNAKDLIKNSSLPTNQSTNLPTKVIAIVDKSSKLDEYFQNNSDIDTFHLKRRTSVLALFSAKKLARTIDNNKIDIIHVHWNKDFLLSVLGKLLSKRRPAIVFTRHMMITREKKDIYHNFLHRHMNLMLTISKELESLCKKFIPGYAEKIVTLYHGVKAPEKFLDEDNRIESRKTFNFGADDFVVGIIGRLEENKGQHLLINAISMAKQHGYNIKALIIGHEMTSGYRDILKKQADDLDISNQITFQDFTQQPQQLMQLCDCIVLATRCETFGLVLPEAMRSGVAVIGSNSGGVPEIIQHDKTGLLFESFNAQDLFKQIERIYLDVDLKNQLAAQGKQDADIRFNDTLHFQQLEKLFRSCIN